MELLIFRHAFPRFLLFPDFADVAEALSRRTSCPASGLVSYLVLPGPFTEAVACFAFILPLLYLAYECMCSFLSGALCNSLEKQKKKTSMET